VTVEDPTNSVKFYLIFFRLCVILFVSYLLTLYIYIYFCFQTRSELRFDVAGHAGNDRYDCTAGNDRYVGLNSE
jgi:hypothetical protein